MFQRPRAQQAAHESRRETTRATRDLEREEASLKAEEKKLILEIKRAANAGHTAEARALARNLVRVRGYMGRLQNTKVQLRSIGTQLQTVHSTAAVTGAVGATGKVLQQVNAHMDPVKAQKMAMDFQKESAKLEHTEEVLGECLGGGFDVEGEEEEADKITEEMLEALSVETRTQMSSAPRKKLVGNPVEADDELVKMLAALKE